LCKDIEELVWRERGEGLRDSGRAVEMRRYVDARGQGREWRSSRDLLHLWYRVLLHRLCLLRVIGWHRVFLIVVRPVDTNLATHDLVVVQVANGGSCCIGVGKVCESISLGLSSLWVHHQTKLGHSSCRAENVSDLFLGEIYVKD
jgi:hypothetical protein